MRGLKDFAPPEGSEPGADAGGAPGGAHKRVFVRLLGSGPLALDAGVRAGFVDPTQLGAAQLGAEAESALELLTPDGQVARLERRRVQAVFFVADATVWAAVAALIAGPRRGGARRAGLPRQGLWVRLGCRDRQRIEGVLDNDLLHLDGAGFWLLPLGGDSPCHRIFVPRSAVEQVTAVEVLHAPRTRRAPPEGAGQFPLFAAPEEEAG